MNFLLGWGSVVGACVLILILFVCTWYQLKKESSTILKDIDSFKDSFSKSPHDRSQNSETMKSLREIALNFDDEKLPIICKEDPIFHITKKIQSKFKHNIWYRLSSNFTGIALVFTFALIAFAVWKIGMDLKQPLNDATAQNLGEAIAQLSFKFAISAGGVLASILFQMRTSWLSNNIYKQTREKVEFLSKYCRLHSSADLEFQNQQAQGALDTASAIQELQKITLAQTATELNGFSSVCDKLSSLSEIDVKVGDLAESVTTQLENVIDRSVGERLALLLNAQKESTDRIAENLGKVLADTIGNELKSTFAQLAETLPNIVSNGAASSSLKMAETFEKMSDSLPGLLESMNGVMAEVKKQQTSSIESSQKINENLLQSFSNAIEKFSSLSVSNTEYQTNLLSKLNSAADWVSENSKKSNLEIQQQLSSSANVFSEKLMNGASDLMSTMNHSKEILGEIEKTANSLRVNSLNTLSETNNTINQFKIIVENVKKIYS